MAIPPISAIGGISSTVGTTATTPATSAAAGGAPGSSSFANFATNAVDSLQQSLSVSDAQAQLAATGQGNPADVMISATEASLQTQLTVAVRDKAVDAFNEIMGMQF